MPALVVDPHDDEPELQRNFREGGGGRDHREEMVGNRRIHVEHPAKAIHGQEDTEDAREEGRVKDEVVGQNTAESELARFCLHLQPLAWVGLQSGTGNRLLQEFFRGLVYRWNGLREVLRVHNRPQ